MRPTHPEMSQPTGLAKENQPTLSITQMLKYSHGHEHTTITVREKIHMEKRDDERKQVSMRCSLACVCLLCVCGIMVLTMRDGGLWEFSFSTIINQRE